MKQLTLRSAILLVAFCAATMMVLAEPHAGIRDGRKAVVYLTTITTDQKLEGTGFVVHPDGVVLTAKHNIGAASATEIKVNIGARDGPEVKVKEIVPHQKRDLAILKLDATGLSNLTLSKHFVPDVTDFAHRAVVLMGFPVNLGLSTPSGEIISVSEPEGLWSVTGATDRGMSGGPVMLKNSAEVVGVIRRKDWSAVGFALIEPVSSEDEIFQGLIAALPAVPEGSLFIINLEGEVRLTARGTGKGQLTDQGTSAVGPAGAPIKLQQRGGESSECRADFERDVSYAEGYANIFLDDAKRLNLNLNMKSHGGHYVTAARNLSNTGPLCLGGKPIGKSGHDTKTWLDANLRSELSFGYERGAAKTLNVRWTDLPAASPNPDSATHIRIVDHKGEIAKWQASGSGSKLVELPRPAAYRMIIELHSTAFHEGSCCGPNHVQTSATIAFDEPK